MYRNIFVRYYYELVRNVDGTGKSVGKFVRYEVIASVLKCSSCTAGGSGKFPNRFRTRHRWATAWKGFDGRGRCGELLPLTTVRGKGTFYNTT